MAAMRCTSLVLAGVFAMTMVMGPRASCAQSFDPVVAQVIALARAHALNAPQVDWPRVQAEAARILQERGDESARSRAIRHVLQALGDGHSHYRAPSRHILLPYLPLPEQEAPADEDMAHSQAPAAGFGHLVISRWAGPPSAVAAARRRVRVALQQAMRHDACGLVIDVARNGGGNMWPMMGGIAPLYDDGTLLSFESRDGTRTAVRVEGGMLRNAADRGTPQPLPTLRRKPRYIALLLGGQTASSAQILALAFRGQPNVRSFGARTRGATTANSTYVLANGGRLALTTARLRDRAGAVQQGPLLPDEAAVDALGAATRWLRGRCRS